jgi:hypothetical protein
MNIKEILPSKKFTLATAIIASVAIVVLILNLTKEYRHKEYTKKETSTNSQVLVQAEQIINEDTDGDGLPDWEESLWGMDPNNPDTNGDGVGDLEEVNKKRPQETLEGSETNQTSLLAENLFQTILSLNQSGSLSNSNLTSIATALGDSVQDALYDNYTAETVQTIATTAENQTNYMNSFNEIFGRYDSTSFGEELSIIPLFLQDPETNQSSLEEISDLYIQISEDLASVPTPSEISLVHLKLINQLHRIGQSLQEILYINDDPIRGVAGVSNYESSTSEAITAIEIIINNQ